MSRDNRSDWTNKGSLDMSAVAMKEAKRIFDTHHPKALDEARVAKIKRIVEAADKDLIGQGVKG